MRYLTNLQIHKHTNKFKLCNQRYRDGKNNIYQKAKQEWCELCKVIYANTESFICIQAESHKHLLHLLGETKETILKLKQLDKTHTSANVT